MNAIYKFLSKCITIIFACILFWLIVTAAVSTTYVGDAANNEKVYMIADSAIMNLISATICTIVIYLISASKLWGELSIKINDSDALYKRIRNIVYLGATFCIMIFLIIVRKEPRSDQMDVCRVAAEWVNKDFSSFNTGQYTNEHPHQLGIIIFLYMFWHLVGTSNYLAFQLLNVVALLWIYGLFAYFIDYIGGENSQKILVICLATIFVPAIMYTTFVYGNLIGLAFILNSVRLVFEYDKTGKYWHLVGILVCSFVAVSFKSNYMIFLIGNIVLCVLLLLKKCNWKMLFVVITLAIVLVSNKYCINLLTKAITGITVGAGASNLSYVAMGMQENSNLYDGWWNYYNTASYEKSGYDQAIQSEIVKEYMRGRIEEFKNDPVMAVDFFSRKNASQWNNPDFEAFWVNRSMPNSSMFPELVRKLFSMEMADIIVSIMNYWHFIILTGVIFYIFFGEKNDVFLLFAMVFIGGFIFHTFWEAKSQYTFTYFMLLLPLTVIGYRSLFLRINKYRDKV